MHHEDPDEVDWLDEGLADWARSLTGYADPERLPTEIGYDKHTQCFLGNLLESPGGPENSLTLWGDSPDINCDYGAAYSLMEYLHHRYGRRLMTALHRGERPKAWRGWRKLWAAAQVCSASSTTGRRTSPGR